MEKPIDETYVADCLSCLNSIGRLRSGCCWQPVCVECDTECPKCKKPLFEDKPVENRRADLYDRQLRAATMLLNDPSDEGEFHLHLLIDNEVYGDALIQAIEAAERYLKGEEK